MADGYSWSESRDDRGYRLPDQDHLGWWVAAAMLVSILLHLSVFFALDRMKIVFGIQSNEEISTQSIDVRQVEIPLMESETNLAPEEVITPPVETKSLLDEVDLLAVLPKDHEIDIKPELIEAEYALRLQNPAREGSPEAAMPESSLGFEIDADLPELGREPTNIKPAEVGQITVDPGNEQVDDSEIGNFTEALIRKGANGKAKNGTLDGIASLDDLLGLSSNVLLGKKTMLPSDLLFDYNSSELRESAKGGLMKLGLLIDRNPNLYCWIEGHTDLLGGDDFNLNLSIKRAEAVKLYLVNSLRMDASKIMTRGFGRYEPLVITGAAEEQKINRRVEIRMRKTPPTKDQLKIIPQKVAVIEEAPARKAVLVRPLRALPVNETPPPKASVVKESAVIIEADPVPKATPIAEEISPAIPRAQAVEEEP